MKKQKEKVFMGIASAWNNLPTIKKGKRECEVCHCGHEGHDCPVHKPSEEKECTCFRPFHNSVEGIIHQKDCPLIAPKQEEWEELKNILKVNILEVSYTQSQENFIDDIKSFISQLLKKEREKVIEEVKKNTKDLTKYETEFTCLCGQEHSVQFLIRKPKVMKGKITEITINSQQLKK